ncbi:MAG: efflux RND transporter permease subunit, partial [Chthonomonas sp.]|nr:efflux RND transporter permease subunit [Chthonomonas sp.]
DTKLRVNGREYPIRVMMDIGDRNNPDIVGQVPLKFAQGRAIYLDSVTDLQQAIGVDKIERRSREQEVRITADLLPGYAAGNVQQQINEYITAQRLLEPEVTQKNLGQADVQQREMGYLMGALVTGLILVFMLLASLYNNLIYPFVIQLAQPQAMTGALLALVLTDKSLNIVGFIGLIALVGLVGKNAILLVDYTNTLRERGKDRLDAILEAGPTRLRPIMMTTIAVILGMLPVALAIGRGSEFRETIGIIIIGGILLSTVLTLVVIPCSYTIFDDILISFTKAKASRAAKRNADATQV